MVDEIFEHDSSDGEVEDKGDGVVMAVAEANEEEVATIKVKKPRKPLKAEG